MRIAILEPLGIPANEFRTALPGHDILELDTGTWTDDQIISKIKECDILVVAGRSLSAQVINSLPNLKYIAVAFAGIDHISHEAVHSRNIPVQNSAGYSTTAVAELVIGMMIALARKIVTNNHDIRQGGVTNTGTELKGKSLGIIGMGNIGSDVNRLARAFEMNVLAYKRGGDLTLEEVFKQSDFISLHISLTPETQNLVKLDLLKMMKPSAYIVNIARGPIINEADLIYALQNKIIAGAALDVFASEPPLPTDSPLFQLPNVILTPHIGYNTKEALVRRGHITLVNVKEFIRSFS